MSLVKQKVDFCSTFPSSTSDRNLRSENASKSTGFRLIALLAIPATIALVVSGYLAYTSFTSSTIAGCSGGYFDCSNVLKSKWSTWFGLPVSLMAVGTYVAMLGSMVLTQRSSERLSNGGWTLMRVLAFSAASAAVWFICLQVFVLEHICPWCLAAHICGLVIATSLIVFRPVGLKINGQAFSVAAVGFLLLVAGQWFAEEPKTYEVIEFSAAGQVDSSALNESSTGLQGDSFDGEFAPPEVDFFSAPEVGEDFHPEENRDNEESSKKVSDSEKLTRVGNVISDFVSGVAVALGPKSVNSLVLYQEADQSADQDSQESNQAQQEDDSVKRVAAFHGSTIKLDMSRWPLEGDIESDYVVVEMFDYNCPHCRQTHQNCVMGAKDAMDDNVAVLVLPLPLNTNCNGAIQQTHPKFVESCELAKLAIAVWMCDKEQFGGFHNWMFADNPKTYAEAKTHAETLVDAETLAKALASDTPASFIQRNVQIYERVGRGNVPKLMFPQTSLVGEVGSASVLADMIKTHGKVTLVDSK